MQRSVRTATKVYRDGVETRNIYTIIRHTIKSSLVCRRTTLETCTGGSTGGSSDSQSGHRQSDGVIHRAQARIKVIATRSSRNKPESKKQTTKTGKQVRDVHPCRMPAPFYGGMAVRLAAECLALASPYHCLQSARSAHQNLRRRRNGPGSHLADMSALQARRE